MYLYEDCIEKAGLNVKQVVSIARRLQKIASECNDIGIQIFGGSGSGSLRFSDDPGNPIGRQLILAHIDGDFSGGDGATHEDDEGFLRGE